MSSEITPQAFFILASFFFVILFGLVVLLYLFGPSPKKITLPEEDPKPDEIYSQIMEILDNRRSGKTQIAKAIEMFFDNYDKMDLTDYKKKSFLFAVAIHPNVLTEMVISVDDDLRRLNPDLTRELNKTLNRALDARGV